MLEGEGNSLAKKEAALLALEEKKGKERATDEYQIRSKAYQVPAALSTPPRPLLDPSSSSCVQ